MVVSGRSGSWYRSSAGLYLVPRHDLRRAVQEITALPTPWVATALTPPEADIR